MRTTRWLSTAIGSIDLAVCGLPSAEDSRILVAIWGRAKPCADRRVVQRAVPLIVAAHRPRTERDGTPRFTRAEAVLAIDQRLVAILQTCDDAARARGA